MPPLRWRYSCEDVQLGRLMSSVGLRHRAARPARGLPVPPLASLPSIGEAKEVAGACSHLINLTLHALAGPALRPCDCPGRNCRPVVSRGLQAGLAGTHSIVHRATES